MRKTYQSSQQGTQNVHIIEQYTYKMVNNPDPTKNRGELVRSHKH